MKMLGQNASDAAEGDARPWFFAASVLILLLAAGLRCYHIGAKSLWFDEAVLANFTGGYFYDFLAGARHSQAVPLIPPGIIWLVQRIDDGPTAVRLPALIASLATVIVVLAM